jgi:hypothetical protein
MLATKAVVHIANKPEESVQDCSRCGQILADLDEADEGLATYTDSFFTPGAFVVVMQRPNFYESIVQADDAGSGQLKCKAIKV